MATRLPQLKIVICGQSAVGKSSLMDRYCLGTFTEDRAATIGVDFRSVPTSVTTNSGNQVKANCLVFDTAGQERYRSLGSAFYRNAVGGLFVYDVTSKDSFETVSNWLEQATSHNPSMITMLVANKIDLLESENQTELSAQDLEWRAQEKSKAEQFAREHEMLYVRTSAKTKEGVTHAFETIIQKASTAPEFQALLSGDAEGTAPKTVNMQNPENTNASGGYGCGCV